jgi:hypothetical protein
MITMGYENETNVEFTRHGQTRYDLHGVLILDTLIFFVCLRVLHSIPMAWSRCFGSNALGFKSFGVAL